jgi:hypothetical protein
MQVIEYILSIKNTRSKLIWILANSLLIVNALILILSILKTNSQQWVYIAAIFILIVAIYHFIAKKKKQWLFIFAAVVICISWIKFNYTGIGLVMLILLSITERIAKDFQLIINQQNLILKTGFNRKFQWTDIQHIIFKEGILTIDFKNNQLLQLTIDNKINETEFNQFCEQQLNQS